MLIKITLLHITPSQVLHTFTCLWWSAVSGREQLLHVVTQTHNWNLKQLKGSPTFEAATVTPGRKTIIARTEIVICYCHHPRIWARSFINGVPASKRKKNAFYGMMHLKFSIWVLAFHKIWVYLYLNRKMFSFSPGHTHI